MRSLASMLSSWIEAHSICAMRSHLGLICLVYAFFFFVLGCYPPRLRPTEFASCALIPSLSIRSTRCALILRRTCLIYALHSPLGFAHSICIPKISSLSSWVLTHSVCASCSHHGMRPIQSACCSLILSLPTQYDL